MTMALCFSCGDVKFGALCPCPKCQVTSSGNIELDIAFSDHHYTVKTLEEFGTVVRAIGAATPDPEIRFWSFIHYLSTQHPSILQARPPPEILARIEAAMRGVTLPPVTVRTSGRAPAGSDPPDAGETSPAPAPASGPAHESRQNLSRARLVLGLGTVSTLAAWWLADGFSFAALSTACLLPALAAGAVLRSRTKRKLVEEKTAAACALSVGAWLLISSGLGPLLVSRPGREGSGMFGGLIFLWPAAVGLLACMIVFVFLSARRRDPPP